MSGRADVLHHLRAELREVGRAEVTEDWLSRNGLTRDSLASILGVDFEPGPRGLVITPTQLCGAGCNPTRARHDGVAWCMACDRIVHL